MKTVIPAQPGYYVLEFVKGDAVHPEHTFNREPVIAWVVTLMRPQDMYDDACWVTPVTAAGLGNTTPTVQNFMGAVENQDQCWPSVEAWFKDQCAKVGVK